MISTHTNPLTFNSIPPKLGLKRALGQSPAEIIDQVSASGLRGRGGAGFPTGAKWSFTASAFGEPKFIICNADEGEPGTFKDRLILADYPDLVLDGMTIAARAVGASEGILYLRAEYTALRRTLEEALQRRREEGFLGQDLAGLRGFDFDIRIFMGAGAYVCGEESALIESMEGFRGEPRNRPPFPAVSGFKNKPTVINNVETFAWVAALFVQSPEWFKGLGTDQSAGPKLFSVSGDCQRPGVYEFPLGLTIEDLLAAVGGEGAKAVQVGGFSGHCVPASQFDRRICFEDVATGGSIIVFGPQRDMLTIAHNILEFFVDESCGQCTPCRVGNVKLLEGVELLRQGNCSMAHLKELISLGESMQISSKCGLGQSSPVAFLSMVEHFKDEIMACGPACKHSERTHA